MRIMLVCRVYPTHRPGGMPHVTEDRAEALAKAGHEVHVVTTLPPTMNRACTVTKNGVTLHYVSCASSQWSGGFASGCEDWHKCLVPDMLHLDSFDRNNVWWADKGAAITMHGFGMGAFLTQWNQFRTDRQFKCEFHLVDMVAEAKALAKARAVIGVSKWEWRMLRDQYGLRQAKLIYNPIAPYFFESQPDPTTRRGSYFLCVGVSQHDTRGFSDLLPGGDVPVKCVARTPRREMPSQYDGAVALLLPTMFCQGFDLAVAEARARGVPAIMSATGSYLDEAMPWDTLVTTGDREELRSVLTSYDPSVHKVPRVWDTSPENMHVGMGDMYYDAIDRHRPARHVADWLACMGV